MSMPLSHFVPAYASPSPSCSLYYSRAALPTVPPALHTFQSFLQSLIYTLPLASRLSLLLLDWLKPSHSSILSLHITSLGSSSLTLVEGAPGWPSTSLTLVLIKLQMVTPYTPFFRALQREGTDHMSGSPLHSRAWPIIRWMPGGQHRCAACVVAQCLMCRKVSLMLGLMICCRHLGNS